MGRFGFCGMVEEKKEKGQTPISSVDSQKRNLIKCFFFFFSLARKAKNIDTRLGFALIVMGSADELAVAREANISVPALSFSKLYLIRQICHN